MNTLSTNLPNTTFKADMLVAPFSNLCKQGSKARVWAFSAAVRLSDQDKPIVLKLLVELAIVIRMLALLAQSGRCATGKTMVVRRAARPHARVSAHRIESVKRSAVATVRQRAVVAVQRALPMKGGRVMESRPRSTRPVARYRPQKVCDQRSL